jgi:hypothetical protein
LYVFKSKFLLFFILFYSLVLANICMGLTAQPPPIRLMSDSSTTVNSHNRQFWAQIAGRPDPYLGPHRRTLKLRVRPGNRGFAPPPHIYYINWGGGGVWSGLPGSGRGLGVLRCGPRPKAHPYGRYFEIFFFLKI